MFFEKASPAFRRRLHKNTAYAPRLGFQPPFLLYIAGTSRQCLGVQGEKGSFFRVFRVFRVFSWFGAYGSGVFSWGLVVGFNFGFGRTKTTRNVNMGFGSDTLSKKMLNQNN